MPGGPRLVYGDGWEDIKDCCVGGGFLGKSSSSGYRDRGCTRSQLAIGILFTWCLVLTIVCIVLASQISSTTNASLSSRLDSLSSEQTSKHSSHSKLLQHLSQSHQSLRGRMDGVASDLGRLNGDVDRLEFGLRGEVRNKLGIVRATLMDALEKVANSVQEIRLDVERGIV